MGFYAENENVSFFPSSVLAFESVRYRGIDFRLGDIGNGNLWSRNSYFNALLDMILISEIGRLFCVISEACLWCFGFSLCCL